MFVGISNHFNGNRNPVPMLRSEYISTVSVDVLVTKMDSQRIFPEHGEERL